MGDRIYKRLVTRGRGKSQIEREVGEDVIERAKVFQIWPSGVRARFVIQKLVRDFGTASYIYIYIYIYIYMYVCIYLFIHN